MGDSSYKSTIDCFVKTLKNDVWFFLLSLLFSHPVFQAQFDHV